METVKLLELLKTLPKAEQKQAAIAGIKKGLLMLKRPRKSRKPKKPVKAL